MGHKADLLEINAKVLDEGYKLGSAAFDVRGVK
jgi:hypothetical protein